MLAHRIRTLLAWSSGKDSAYALWALRQLTGIEMVGLLTTLNSAANRISMHAVRESVLEAQARACRLPLPKVPLPDVRAYREAPTPLLAKEMINAGLEAIITCVDTNQLDGSFVGRSFDHQLLEDLPDTVDPCAENGEFHTLAVAGPMFRERLDVELGEVVDRGRFLFADVTLRGGQVSSAGMQGSEESEEPDRYG